MISIKNIQKASDLSFILNSKAVFEFWLRMFNASDADAIKTIAALEGIPDTVGTEIEKAFENAKDDDEKADVAEEHPEIVVCDLEYTAWAGSLQRGWSDPGEHREIVQIAAIRLSTVGQPG